MRQLQSGANVRSHGGLARPPADLLLFGRPVKIVSVAMQNLWLFGRVSVVHVACKI